MGFRFQRRLTLLKGLTLNMSKSGPSLTLGGRGASLNLGQRGITGNAGISGTGLSYRAKLSQHQPLKKLLLALFWLGLMAALGYLYQTYM
jgi:hypothetical protein